ncbi:MAG: altronate dehydratase family protein [Oscillospiraceae bacterium]|nr:altronate dehydratase family protein [Oscillospiraceae bacterium]
MKLLKINPTDNVAVALEELSDGEMVNVDGAEITVLETVKAGHKLAISDIATGEAVTKYGHPIGTATVDISIGQTVHTHNLKTALDGVLEYTYNPSKKDAEKTSPTMFRGYRRKDGKTGIRNEVWIIPTVGCVNATAQKLEAEAKKLAKKHSSIDGVYSFCHPYGCSQLGDDHENTRRAITGLIDHPNAGAVLVLGLGCENNDVAGVKKLLGDFDPDRVKFLICQDCEDEVEAGIRAMSELIEFAGAFERENTPMSELVVGLKCGGSDGFSGITANPLAGAFADRLISEGGAIILTEVPEMFGAETILMDRCETSELFERTVAMINDFKNYYIKNGQNVYENPSPGNKAGGITTLEDKSLGCVQKGGSTNVMDVLGYCEPVRTRGLNLLTGPGNDLVSVSAMTASGAHLILFTTGLGTPFGAPAPTVKISSNTALYDKKRNWIDFDAGRLLTGVSMEVLRDELYEYVRALASGETVAKNETLGAREFTIFKTGITL